MTRRYDLVVIGGGHAGAEAAWAAAGVGVRVGLVTLEQRRIGQMSCNPAIGGLAKGQMVREIDALGGLMGRAIDQTGIQFRMLNRSKGAAVWGPRAQADKALYAQQVQRMLQQRGGIEILAAEAVEILIDARRHVRGVMLADGSELACGAAIVTTGTFLRGLMHTGEQQTLGGRIGEAAAMGLSASLAKLGLELGRLKTGTPPRLDRESIDFSAFEEQRGDEPPAPFSYLNEYEAQRTGKPWRPPLEQLSCWLSATTPRVHELIRANLHRAPLYSGQIQGTGPRYCPSIEDKVVRFAEKQRHTVFLEPEGLESREIYCNGISTSLPADVQEAMVRAIGGLEKAKIIKFGYAVEYDMVWPTQIGSTMETRSVRGLFLAGQINGTSGYEEAAAQGLVAAVNAAARLDGREPDFVPGREQAYIGVMIDDLVLKPPTEPYRMFTSRAEHRLLLRADNADLRLSELGHRHGLLERERWEQFCQTQRQVEETVALVGLQRVEQLPAGEWLKQPEHDFAELARKLPALAQVDAAIGRRVEIQVKYEGYIARQQRQMKHFSQLDQKRIPPGVDYALVAGLRSEARQKLSKLSPGTLGQALRISGLTPADITVLAIHLSKMEKKPQ